MARNGNHDDQQRNMARLEGDARGENDSEDSPVKMQAKEVVLDGEIMDPESIIKENMPSNMLVEGDNLPVMQLLLANGWIDKINLIYIDPPFWSGEDYYTNSDYFTNGDEVLAYKDRWDGGLDSYLSTMRVRLELMRKMLVNDGSIFVHVDWHAGHYIKVLLDEIFGMENLRNEIIWYYGGPSPVKSSFPRKHDVIFFYSKGKNYKFTPQYAPIKQYLRGRARQDPDGRLWVDQNVGRITRGKFDELASEGRVFVTKAGNYRRKQYLDEMEGDMIDDVWTIPIINSQATERLGFPTQKPEALLQRIIECASEPGDVVADFFCGSGTTLAVAQQLKRGWIGVDSSSIAIQTARARLLRDKTSRFMYFGTI
ncbi:MAG TPA: site-specific DNA-methyltransferase [Candidatus Lokiarchaeia archaeon]|nr:site-specific DNA-methyltransferase [Candidatus Lokiarchaeia archaeon]